VGTHSSLRSGSWKKKKVESYCKYEELYWVFYLILIHNIHPFIQIDRVHRCNTNSELLKIK
jgi:hypothetical protein